MLELFAFDLDRTLLIDGRIRGRNRDALQALEREGKICCLVSGRVLPSPRFLAQDAGLSAYAIGANGAVGADPNGRILFESSLPPPVVKRLEEIGLDLGIYFHYYSRDAFLSPYYRPDRFQHLVAGEIADSFSMQCRMEIWEQGRGAREESHILKFQYHIASVDARDRLVAQLRTVPGITTTWSGTTLFEVMAEGVNKWKALETLADQLGLSSDEICAMGDQDNDLQMVKNSGFGVAMDNAVPEVKAVSDFVSTPYDEDGVYAAIMNIRQRGLLG